MDSAVETPIENHVGLVADIVSAYVSNNSVAVPELGSLIASIHKAVHKVANGQKHTEPVLEALVPSVVVKKSVHRDHIVCLEDGLKFKSLKRHLGANHNMSPDEYRTKWKLPHDYPMVAPAYAEQRSALAKASGLGNLRKAAKKKAKK